MHSYDPFARYYDADFRDYIDDIVFLREMARRAGGPILELMCGSGRALLPLAEEGYAITGVDSSPVMLELARARIAQADLGDRVVLIESDVRTVSLPANHFALAFVAVNSFMHLEEVGDQLAALATVRRALDRKGLLIIDLFNPDLMQMTKEDNRLMLERSYVLDGNRVHKFVAIDSDLAAQTSHVTYFYDEHDSTGQLKRRVMNFTMRWFYRYEMEHLLARAGFLVRSVYGSYDLDAYTTESPRLVVVASPDRR